MQRAESERQKAHAADGRTLIPDRFPKSGWKKEAALPATPAGGDNVCLE